MGIKNGNKEITSIKLGTTNISSVYLGSNLIWSGMPAIYGKTTLSTDFDITEKDGSIILDTIHCKNLGIDEDGYYSFKSTNKPSKVIKFDMTIINLGNITELNFNTDNIDLSQLFLYTNKSVKKCIFNKPLSNIYNGGQLTLGHTFCNCNIEYLEADLSNITIGYLTNVFYLNNKLPKECMLDKFLNTAKIIKPTVISSVFCNCTQITGDLDISSWDFTDLRYTQNFVGGCKNLESITGLSNLLATSSQWINASGMFNSCEKLSFPTSINLPLTNCTNTQSLFKNCKGLTNITLSGNKSTSVSGMFTGCSNLVTADISNFDLHNVGPAVGMFQDCANLENIGTGTVLLDLSSVATTQSMFYNCYKLANNIKLKGGDNITNASLMFCQCNQLTNIDISDFTITDKCTHITSMFASCKLNSNFEFVLSGKDLSGMIDMSSLFSRKELPTIKKCDLSNNTWSEEGVNCNFMFRWGDCEYVDFRGLKPNSMAMCFYQAVYKTIDLRGCDTSLCTNMTTNFSIINTPAEHFYIDSNYFNTNIAVIPLGGILGTNIESITSVLNSLIDHPKTKLENWDSEDDYDNWLYSQTLQIRQSTFDFIQNNETLKALFDEATNAGWEISS